METSELKKIAQDLRECIEDNDDLGKQAEVKEIVTKKMDLEKTKEFMKLAQEQGFTFKQVVEFLNKSGE